MKIFCLLSDDVDQSLWWLSIRFVSRAIHLFIYQRASLRSRPRSTAGILAEISPRRETRKRRRAILIGQCAITPEIYALVSRRRRIIALMNQRNGIGNKNVARKCWHSRRISRRPLSSPFVAFPETETEIYSVVGIVGKIVAHVEEFWSSILSVIVIPVGNCVVIYG